AQARPLAQALVDSGLHTAEVTFRTPQALDALAVFASHPELLVGAGTVRAAEQVRRAQDAGARFVVSPGFSETVVAACRSREVPVFPGVSSATDIHRATEAGLDVLKFFPAEASGGAPAIAALSAPFTDVRFIPTGGVGPHNLADYLALRAVCCVGGSWMVPGDVMRAGGWRRVTELCRGAVEEVARVRSGR
ncbi:MAG: 2-dehydro-3-deoxyphosphogluconate aldolase / (4S)-4-hydroxy-2-oxoglutarate aldolase, partial [Pseudonocardiales bacterium]|nr:2-dehydro-3-deoxyphosphogluconate aldolase / (4S)-4-hydroxy-2-oxoglutarate aldolase [Pseudonocardiales bacterium]